MEHDPKHDPNHEELDPIVLGPCMRDGRADLGDWWQVRHAQCTGSHHLPGGLSVVPCACSCHHKEAKDIST